MGPPHFETFQKLVGRSKKKTEPRGPFRIFGKLRWARGHIWGPGGAQFGKAGVVCVCGVDGVSNDVFMTCFFLRCVFERYDVVCHLCATRKKTPLAATQAFSLRTQAAPIFSNISRLPAHAL